MTTSVPVPSSPIAPKKPRKTWPFVLAGCCLICVPAICIGPAIVIPAMINYVKRGKTVEAHTQLSELAAAVHSACRENHQAPITAGPLPLAPGRAKQYGDFERDPGFVALGFAPQEALYYSYAVQTDPDRTYVISAEGDLDADGIRSRFVIRCSTRCACADIVMQDELE